MFSAGFEFLFLPVVLVFECSLGCPSANFAQLSADLGCISADLGNLSAGLDGPNHQSPIASIQ